MISDNGFTVVADSVEFNPNTSELADLVNTSSRLIQLDMNLNVTSDHSYHRETKVVVDGEERIIHTDFHANGVTKAGNNLITLGTLKGRVFRREL